MDKHHFSNERHNGRDLDSQHKYRKFNWLSGLTGGMFSRIDRGEVRYLILDTLVKETYPFDTAKRYIL